MTEQKPDASNSVRSAGDLFGKIEQIAELENQVLFLKKQLLMESALGAGEEQFEHPSFLLVKSKKIVFAAPLQYVDEIVEMPYISPLPRPVASVSGTVDYHGEVLAVIDIEELTTGNNTSISPTQVLVICTIDNRRLALKVDEAIEVITVEMDAITMTDKVLPGIMKSSGLLRLSNNESALILDLMWIGVGAHLGSILSDDAATPKE
ncbi:MAG: chemotaxis protein CheW [Deltaproteobacteria bacterium]|nr:chemotaxis protein CheW [Deltaproteobacteria bacterium]MBN2672726.1 chemotaxis protein CheW [Deltaproteobacteria bacterium]